MGINYAKHRKSIERMYEDTCTIFRHRSVKDPIKKTTRLEPQKLFENLKCKLSKAGLPKNGQTEAQNDVVFDAKLFIAPEIEILQGDLIEVVRASTGRKESYTAGKPFPPYSSHQEISLSFRGWA
ncbi:ABC transporter ATP-binding protein [Paenibacillus sp. L3-i20]|uniref:ABC transporter ATP-binding protein n=1 Tax=Paenibacillus sp. L3-i20 TaxID=2905833 RepID=UPI001EE057CB|nr:ABC transporter ATP-binding protein [Paenibacillus sp. L3-i20]GKU79862.1 phage protein [Paenibacillus sp. L3-i20]